MLKKIKLFFDRFSYGILLILLIGTPLHALLSTGLLYGAGLNEWALGSALIAGWKELLMGLFFLWILVSRAWWENRVSLFIVGLFLWGGLVTILNPFEGGLLMQFVHGFRADLLFITFLFALWNFWPSLSRFQVQLLQKTALFTALGVLLFGLILQVFGHEWLRYLGFRDDWSTYYLGEAPAFCQKEAATGVCRLQSTFAGPNRYASYLLSVLVLLFLPILKRRWVQWVFLPLCLLSLYFTSSTSAFMAVGVMGLVFLLSSQLSSWKLTKKVWMPAVMTLVLLGLVFLLQFDFSSLSDSNSLRLSYLMQSWESFMRQPWGQGMGVAGPASYHLAGQFISENWILDLMVNFGFIGLIFFFGLWGALLSSARQLSPWLWMAFAGVMVHFLFHSLEDAGALVLWIFLLVYFAHTPAHAVQR